jgi:hypothetical protein
MKITFYGSSDDLIEVEGDAPGCDEYSGEKAIFVVSGLRVTVEYLPAGVWGIAVAQVAEGMGTAAENMRLSIEPRMDGDPGYSMRLELEVPDDASVVREYEGAA